MNEFDEQYLRALSKASDFFAHIGALIENRVSNGDVTIDVTDLMSSARMPIERSDLKELNLPNTIPVVRFLPWKDWFPWRPLWNWWWNKQYPSHQSWQWWWCGHQSVDSERDPSGRF